MDRQIGKLIARIDENSNMDGTTAQSKIDNPYPLELALKTVLVPAMTFPAWRKIKLGTGLKTADAFREALKDAHCNIGDWGNDILDKPALTVSIKEKEVELVIVSVAQLGFKDGAVRANIYRRAQELGLDLCSIEVGPQLRLQYKDQPKGQWLLIGMEPLTDSDGNLSVFYMGRHADGGRWLLGNIGRPCSFWFADFLWVFQCRKQAVP
jgi:hypothetical protein